MIFGATGNGVTDDTIALQTAFTAAAGKILYIPSGNYLTSSTVNILSNTVIIGSGYGTRWFTNNTTGFNYINNINNAITYNATTKGDHDITISGIFFDYGSLNDGGTHAIGFRMAQNITVRDCYFNGGNDATAMLACQTTLVENCRATGLSNCAYDHWDGAQDFTVRKCYATMIGGNGLLATGTDTTGVQVRTTDGGLFEDCEIHGGGVGLYMNAGYTGCIVQNVTARNLRFYGTAGGVVGDGTSRRHTIDNIYWISGGSAVSASSGDCAVRASSAVGGTPSDWLIDKIHIINSTTYGSNTAMIQINGTRHTVGEINCVGAAINNGTLTWFNTNANLCVLRGPVTADSTSITNITYGLYQGNSGAFDNNTQILCVDPWNTELRVQGINEDHFGVVNIHTNGNLQFPNQTSGASTGTATLTNSPSSSNPAFWLPVKINGTVRYIPAW